MGSVVSSSSKTVNVQREVALPEANGVPSPEIVCGKDERVQVDPMTSPPYKWVCFLSTYYSKKGLTYVASGFKIYLPDVGRTAIVTSGHVTYSKDDGGYPDRITVKFPGQTAIIVRDQKNMYAAPEFISSSDADYDYGLILLPGAGTSDDGFGWSAVVPDEELNNRLVTNCGYPNDKPSGTMWITGGKITSATKTRIMYMNDTFNGESGSPVYTWYGGYWTVVGVHHGATPGKPPVCPNIATRFTIPMIYRFLEFMKEKKQNSLKSAAFPDVYIRCDGSGVSPGKPAGGGTVNCQYTPPGPWEKFYICPVEVPPSLAPDEPHKVVIESTVFPNVFIRLDSNGFNGPSSSTGGGVVDSQYNAGPWEIYYLQKLKASSSVAFRSVQFPHLYIRLDGGRVHSHSPTGGGTVNCQWYIDPYSTPPAVGSYESFCIA